MPAYVYCQPRNTAVGYIALANCTDCIGNVTIGEQALLDNLEGDINTALGRNVEPGVSNTIRLGNTAVTTIGKGHLPYLPDSPLTLHSSRLSF